MAFGSRKSRDCTIYVAETNALISCAEKPLFSHSKQKAGFLMTLLNLRHMKSIVNKVLSE